MRDKPRVSIGMPIFDGENYLKEALDSILAQTYSDFELIISDNASTDRTEEICRAYAAKDPRIRYYRNEKNLGAARDIIEIGCGTGEFLTLLCERGGNRGVGFDPGCALEQAVL